MDCLYRVESRSKYIASFSMPDEYEYAGEYIYTTEYPIIKRTPKGAWIKYVNEKGKKFVLLTARKQFACNTEKEALESFIARKKRQAHILTKQIQRVNQAKYLAECRLKQEELQERIVQTRPIKET